MHDPKRVLFVCDGAAARAQMAEALLRSLSGQRFDVHSAVMEMAALNPLALKAMQEIGIDISRQTLHHINDFEEVQFDYVISLCDEAKESCLSFPRDIENLHWTCPDPTEVQGSEEQRLEAFRKARDQLRQQLEHWLAEMKDR